ncbi:type II toxin-antitoxin system RelE/ParE family toxin [Maridesulfovibrio frigidus]|uniref:type II toxin-antitoxin system RelE/ParE family toxin n=1 Tax=Maridesulfovibrio frigidus TaxID=340956 RepID=UPI0004E27733|nr:type II toxin-antitoxin system RelE/ParE family toxin [Maridesulfovibrio frigidus]
MPKWTKPAQQDLISQLEYIQQENPDIISRIAAQIKKATSALDSFPQLGRDGSVEGTKELIIPNLPFICVYRWHNDQVEILRFLHDRMRWPL